MRTLGETKHLIVMKIVIYAVLMAVIFAGCKGEKGDVGPAGIQGATGEKGNTGAVGPAGPAGTQGVAGPAGPQGQPGPSARYYDFVFNLAEKQIWDFPKKLESNEMALTYIIANTGGTGLAMLPFRGYAYTADEKDFLKLDCYTLQYDFFLSFRNETILPKGASFKFRTVVIKTVAGGRLNLERYQNYENLKSDFNLKD